MSVYGTLATNTNMSAQELTPNKHRPDVNALKILFHPYELTSNAAPPDDKHANELSFRKDPPDVKYSKVLTIRRDPPDAKHAKELTIRRDTPDAKHAKELTIRRDPPDAKHAKELTIRRDTPDVNEPDVIIEQLAGTEHMYSHDVFEEGGSNDDRYDMLSKYIMLSKVDYFPDERSDDDDDDDDDDDVICSHLFPARDSTNALTEAQSIITADKINAENKAKCSVADVKMNTAKEVKNSLADAISNTIKYAPSSGDKSVIDHGMTAVTDVYYSSRQDNMDAEHETQITNPLKITSTEQQTKREQIKSSLRNDSNSAPVSNALHPAVREPRLAHAQEATTLHQALEDAQNVTQPSTSFVEITARRDYLTCNLRKAYNFDSTSSPLPRAFRLAVREQGLVREAKELEAAYTLLQEKQQNSAADESHGNVQRDCNVRKGYNFDACSSPVAKEFRLAVLEQRHSARHRAKKNAMSQLVKTKTNTFEREDRELAVRYSDIQRDIQLYKEEIRRLKLGFAEDNLTGVQVPPEFADAHKAKNIYLGLKLPILKAGKKAVQKQRAVIEQERNAMKCLAKFWSMR